MKKTLSILTAIVLMATIFISACASVSAAQSDRKIYFQPPVDWKYFDSVFCYIWVANTEENSQYAPWGSKKTRATNEGDGTWSYTVPEAGQFGDYNVVIWYTDTGLQTYDLSFGKCCFDDTAYIADLVIENPVDSEKTSRIALWTKHTEFGPMKYETFPSEDMEGWVSDPTSVVCPYDIIETTAPSTSEVPATTTPVESTVRDIDTPETGSRDESVFSVALLLLAAAAFAVVKTSRKTAE